MLAIQSPGGLGRVRLAFAALLIALMAIGGCKKESQGDSQPKTAGERASGGEFGSAPADALVLRFFYGSEKKDWVQEATRAFNAGGYKTANGRAIFVEPRPMGSGDCIDEAMTGTNQPHLISPASGVFIEQGNARYRATAGRDLLPSSDTVNLIVSPVVIAMWEPMARALGWPEKPVGWREVLELSRSRQGWATYGKPEWGAFRFGHTHPEYSNSGIISVLATLYAASGKTANLTVDDLNRPEVAAYLRDIERAVVHYGSSTGFFADRMFEAGPGYLSAAVLYESSVIDSRNKALPGAMPVVAIYPSEGTFWSDHPAGVIDREWVTPEHRSAAKKYIDFLRAPAQQQAALRFGFRPGDTAIAMGAPIDVIHGVDPAEPRATLPVPPAAVVNKAIEVWRTNKKHTDVVLVFDTSGSMQQENRIAFAKQGAREMVNMLGDEDTLSILQFSDRLNWLSKFQSMKNLRAAALATIDGFVPQGGTALYDSVIAAHEFVNSAAREGRITAIVVLTDGADTANRSTLESVVARIRERGDAGGVRIFTIAYGSDAQRDVLKRISDESRGKSYVGRTDDIRTIFREIATFF